MAAIVATVTRLTASDFPGWVELQFSDAVGNQHVIVEKVPVLFAGDFDEAALPMAVLLPCVVGCTRVDPVLGQVAEIDTSKPYGIESVDGRTRFEVLCSQFCMYCPRCGEALAAADQGESRCVKTDARISSEMTRVLRDRFVFGRTQQSRHTSRLDAGAVWFCPGCGTQLRDGVCEQCSASLDDLVYPLVEFNPHP